MGNCREVKIGVLVLMLLPSILLGADPSLPNKTEIILDDVSGGLSTTLPAYKIGKDYSPYMRNVIVDNGKLDKPNGILFLGSTNTLLSGQGIFPYYDDTGVVSYYVTDSSLVLKTPDFNFYTFVSSGHNTSVVMRCKQARSSMFCSNGIDPVFEHATVKTILDGTKGNPSVPRGKYQEYYLERLFEGNLPNNPAQVCYSDVKSTNGVAIALDNFLAWPVGNCFNVGQGDGQGINAMWIQNGQLQFGKERSKYTLFGTNTASFIPRKTSDIGVASNDSLVMIDGQAHYVGQDGIYRDETRISDLIQAENNSISRDASRVVQNLWESQPDFGKGQVFGTTVPPNGILSLSSATYVIHPSTYFNRLIAGDRNIGTGATFYGPVMIDFRSTASIFTTSISSYEIVFTTSIVMLLNGGSAAGCPAKVIINNLFTGASISTISAVYPGGGNPSGSGGPVTFTFISTNTNNTSTMTTEGWQMHMGSYSVTVEGVNGAGCPFVVNDIRPVIDWTFGLQSATTGQFLSEVSTLNVVTSWGKFDSARVTNGGGISYFVRTSTSSVNITTQVWTSVGPGTNIMAPTINNYVQWAATITSISTTTFPQIDNVLIEHVEGQGAVNRAFGLEWRNRYWLFVSTGQNATLSLLLMKSRITNKNPDAWMPIEGINIRSIAKDNANALYGGASTMPWFYRLDYGTNYNGTPINSIYRTSEIFMDNPFNEKSLFEYYLVADQQASKTLWVRTYIDGSNKFTRTISLNGSGRTNRVIQNVIGKGKFFSWEFTNNELDKGLGLTNFAVNYTPTGVRKGANE